MPRTIGSHFLMHSVEKPENNPHREVDSLGEAQKHREEMQGKEPEMNPEQKMNHQHIHEYVDRQQQAMADAREAARKEQAKQERIVAKQKHQREEDAQKKKDGKFNAADREEKSAKGDQNEDTDRSEKQGETKQVAKTSNRGSEEQGKERYQLADKSENKIQEPQGKQQQPKQQDEQDKQQSKSQDKQDKAQDDQQQKQQKGKEPEGKQQQQKKDEQQDEAQQQKQQKGKEEPDEETDKMKNFRSKLPTADQPRTELTKGKHPQELSDSSKERRDLRDTRIDRSKYDSEEDMNEEGRRQIEAQRVPEDVEEGRPAPSNVGRTLLLPKHETEGNWQDMQRDQLSRKAGSEDVMAPQPTSPGKYSQAIRENDDQMKRHGIIRQGDLENKLDTMGEPGRTTKMQQALQYQKARENDSPQQSSERQQMRQKEEAGDNKSPVDKITQQGWRETTEPGKLYTQSKEGKEKSGDAGTEKKEEKKLSPQEEKKERLNRVQQQHRNFYEEIARRKAGMTPYEQLDSLQFVDNAKERHEREEEQGNPNDIAFARRQLQQEEAEWRERQGSALAKMHEIQQRQSEEIEEGKFRREFRERERKFREGRENEDEGIVGNFKNFASDKWHDLTHGKDEQKDDFWGRNEQQNRAFQQRRTTPPASPVTPTSGRRALGDASKQQRSPLQKESEQPAKRSWWIFGGGLQHFAPQWSGKENTRFIDSLTDDELSMMSL